VDDSQLTERIEALVAEEHELFTRGEEEEGLTREQHERLERVRVSLDQCWDLLRQRRARRDAGLDPDDASVRGEDTVERYEQ
jgi:hypothetical protein